MNNAMRWLVAAALAGSAATALMPEADACSYPEHWELIADDGHPANGVFVSYQAFELTAEVDGVPAAVIPSSFGVGDDAVFLDPAPRSGSLVQFFSGSQSRSLTVGPRDDVAPQLDGYFFDLHVYPEDWRNDSCGSGPARNLRYTLHVPGVEEHEYVFIELHSADRSQTFVTTGVRVRAEPVVEVTTHRQEIGNIAPEDVCITVRVSDIAGNALTPVTSCAPCHRTQSDYGTDPTPSDDDIFAGGVCETPAPTTERLPGLAPTPEPSASSTVVSSCSAARGGAPASGHWPIIALGLLALGRRARSSASQQR